MNEWTKDQVDGLLSALLGNQVFGTPVEKHGVVLVPVAEVRGCGGSGGARGPRDAAGVFAGAGEDRPDRSSDADDRPGGSDGPGPQAGGGGFALVARPVGAWVIRDGNVEWRSSLNMQALATAASVTVTALAVLTTWAIRRGCCSRRRRG